jgi:[acyl-carrier-protein] S-malonyltransferase
MSLTFLFPGQGSETPGMGGPALLRSRRLQAWLARASAIVGMDVGQAIERGLPALRRTEVAQSALTAVGISLYESLAERDLRPDLVAGHSVGEIAAFAAAGIFAPELAVQLAAQRGRLMAAAAEAAPGGMLALKAASADDLREALTIGARAGRIDLAADNAPGEAVLAGNFSALAAVAARFDVMPLRVAGPWHSRAMADAEQTFRRLLDPMRFRPPRCGLVANRDGRLVGTDANLADLLGGQLTRPIAWAETMTTLVALGTHNWVILGPGRALAGLVRRNVGPNARITVVRNEHDLASVAAT